MNTLPLLGLDSFAACVALSAYRLPWYERCCLAVMFGLCDGMGTLLCTAQGSGLQVVPLLASYFLFALLLVCGAPISRRLLIVLPVGLGIDNLFGTAPVAGAFAAGLSSLAWALLGLQVGAGVRWVFSPIFGRLPAAITNR